MIAARLTGKFAVALAGSCLVLYAGPAKWLALTVILAAGAAGVRAAWRVGG